MRNLSQLVAMKMFRDPAYFEELHWRSWIKSMPKISVSEQGNSEFARAWAAADKVEGWLDREQGLLLYVLARQVSPDQDIVEIGSYKGRSTVVLASAIKNTNSVLHAIDPHTGDGTPPHRLGIPVDTWSEFKTNLVNAGVAEKVDAVRDRSENAARHYNGKSIGLLFIDGLHETEAVLIDWISWKDRLAPDSVIVFDDWWRPPVSKAIMTIESYLPPRIGSLDKELVYGPARSGIRSE